MSMSKQIVDYTKTNSDPMMGVSICIPRVFNNITYRRVKEVFIRMRWGFVERVDLVPMRGFKRAYVHFRAGEWNTRNEEAMDALNAMVCGEEVTVTYDDPWFWKLGISRSKRPEEAPKPKPGPKVRIGALKPAVDGLSVEVSKTPPSSPAMGKEEGEL